jgi:hypothetical protein
MCQKEGCKYIEIIVDVLNKKKWYIHYKMEKKYFLKELFREEVEYDEATDDEATDDE